MRKLAAIDLTLLGARFILIEFGIGVAGSIAIGLLTLRAGIYRFHSTPTVLFGVYLLLLGINYVPLLLHAISMARDGSALQEIGGELGNKQAPMRKYRRQSIFLLLPLVVPIAAIVLAARRGRSHLAEE